MAKAKAKEEVVEQPPITDGEGAQVDSISLNDLQVLANIVDLASQRGAFRGNELTQVGAVFDKLSAFLQQVAAAQAANAEAEGETPAEGAEAATAKDGDAAKKDDKPKEGADKKPDEKKPAEKKPAEKK